MLADQRARLEAIGVRALEAFEKSQNDLRKPGGDAGFLLAAIQIHDRLAKLFGLNAPELIGVSWGATVDAALVEARRRVQAELEASSIEVGLVPEPGGGDGSAN